MSNYSLNPCKACWEKYRRGGCNINTVNSCVSETAAAFAGIPSANFLVGTDADKNWQGCMEKMMSAEDRSKCDLHLNIAPVFHQAPHYFPSLLASTHDPETSKLQCIKQCDELRFNKKTCIENCITDSDAVMVDIPVNSDLTTPLSGSQPDTKQYPKNTLIYLAVLALVISGILAIYMYLNRK